MNSAFGKIFFIVVGCLLSLGGGSFARAQAAPLTPPRVLFLGARAAAEGDRELSRALAMAVEGTVADFLRHSGATILRLQPGEGTGCKHDLDCISKNLRQPADLLLELTVQRNPDDSFYLGAVLHDNHDVTKTQNGNLPYVPEARLVGRPLDQAVGQKAAELVGTLMDKWNHTEVQVQSPPVSHPVQVTVTTRGPGRVVSEPAGISCGEPAGPCSSTFSTVKSPQVILLRAYPRGTATLLDWGGASCTGLRCELPLHGDPHLTVRFGRSSGRKVLTGVLGALGAAGLVSAAVLFGLNGHDSSACTSCVKNTVPSGAVSLGLGVVFGVGAAVAWWLPTSKE